MTATLDRIEKAATKIDSLLEETTDPKERQSLLDDLAVLKTEYGKLKGAPPTPKDEAVAEVRNQAKVDPLGVTSAVLTGLTKATLDTADLPFDILNMVIDTASNLSGVNLPRTATPTQAVDFLTNLAADTKVMERLKTPSPAVDTAFERILSRGVEFGAGGATGAGVVRAGANRLSDVNRGVQTGRQMSPVNTTAGSIAADSTLVARETAAGVVGGIGFGGAEELTDNPYIQMASAMVGGALPSVATSTLPPLLERGKRTVGNFTRRGAELRVGNVLVENATDAGQAIENLTTNKIFMDSVLPEAQVSSGKLADDPGLARTIDAALGNDPQLVNTLEQSTTQSVEALKGRLAVMGASGKPSDFVDSFNDLTLKEIETLGTEIDYAKNLLAKIEASRTGVREGPEISEDYVAALEASYKNAKSKERLLWEAVDRTEPLNTGTLKQRVLSLRARLKKEGIAIGKFPDAIFNKVAEFGTKEGPDTFGGLQNYRSEVLEDIRIANKNNQNSVAMALGKLEEELRAVLSTSGNSDAQRAAAEYTKVLHDNYNRGKLGKLLNLDSQGDKRIDPEIALKSIVRQGDDIGNVKRSIALEREQLLESGETFPAASGLTTRIEESLRAKFATADTPAARERFFKQYGSTLDQFPELSRDLKAVSKEIETVAETIASKEGRVATLLDKNKTAMGALLGTDPEDAYKVVSKLNEKDLTNILNIAKREGVEQGLQAIYIREILNGLANTTNLKGSLGKLLRGNEGLRKGYSLVLSPEQRKGLSELQRAADLLLTESTGQRPKNVTDIFSAGILTQLLARVGGVRAAGMVAPAGPSALQMSAAFAATAKKLVSVLPSTHAEAVIERAVTDPEYMKALMKLSLDSRRMTEKQITNKLRIFFSQAGVNAEENEEEAANKPPLQSAGNM
jgi:hypothetical protein